MEMLPERSEGASRSRRRGERIWTMLPERAWRRHASVASDGMGANPFLDATAGGMLAEVAARFSDREALVAADRRLSYAALWHEARRFARALLRPDARLVILDEPFRGLERGQRRELLARARRFWRDATLLCVTHDVAETADFERVVVIEGGRIVEQGAPAELGAGSRYRALLEGDERARRELWSASSWRRARLDDGRLRFEERS